jgi:molybdopterin-binding protein
MKQRLNLINLLRVRDVRFIEGHWVGQLGEQVLHLPADAALAAGQCVHVQFLTRDVVLAADQVGGVSARNRLHGRVRELVALADRTFVAIDVGQFLWAEVTPEAVQELRIVPDKVITCLIKASAVTLVR